MKKEEFTLSLLNEICLSDDEMIVVQGGKPDVKPINCGKGCGLGCGSGCGAGCGGCS